MHEQRDSFYRTILDHITNGVYFVDRDRNIVYWNKAAESITGFPAAEVIGHCCADNILTHINDEGTVLCTDLCPLAKTIEDGKIREADVFLHHKSGHRVPVTITVSPIRDDAGDITGAVEVFRDISGEKAQHELLETFRKAASIDTLTELPNRSFVDIKIRTAFEEMRRHGIPFGIIFADIDRFKVVNDTYGHQVGDEVLRMVARTMEHNVRAYDLVGRWGGEEFVIILSHIRPEKLEKLSEKIRQLVEQSYIVNSGSIIRVTITMGATMARKNDTVASLVNRADQLLYEGKSSGRNRVMADPRID